MKQDQANAQAKINAQQEALQAQRRDKTGALKEEIAGCREKATKMVEERQKNGEPDLHMCYTHIFTV